jgi:hypothetical protein
LNGLRLQRVRNFNAAAGQTFPPEFLALVDDLGVNPMKLTELCPWCSEPSGLYLTGGWFHFIGSILAGEDVLQWSNGSGTFRFEALAPGVEFGFSASLALVREAFETFPLVQLEFQTRVPWVFAEPEPGCDHEASADPPLSP